MNWRSLQPPTPKLPTMPPPTSSRSISCWTHGAWADIVIKWRYFVSPDQKEQVDDFVNNGDFIAGIRSDPRVFDHRLCDTADLQQAQLLSAPAAARMGGQSVVTENGPWLVIGTHWSSSLMILLQCAWFSSSPLSYWPEESPGSTVFHIHVKSKVGIKPPPRSIQRPRWSRKQQSDKVDGWNKDASASTALLIDDARNSFLRKLFDLVDQNILHVLVVASLLLQYSPILVRSVLVRMEGIRSCLQLTLYRILNEISGRRWRRRRHHQACPAQG